MTQQYNYCTYILNKNDNSKGHIHLKVHWSIIYNNWDMDAT